jgi:hypothetical protein
LLADFRIIIFDVISCLIKTQTGTNIANAEVTASLPFGFLL